jgi:hypothetical protein
MQVECEYDKPHQDEQHDDDAPSATMRRTLVPIGVLTLLLGVIPECIR